MALGRLMDALPDGSPLLANIGEKFQVRRDGGRANVLRCLAANAQWNE